MNWILYDDIFYDFSRFFIFCLTIKHKNECLQNKTTNVSKEKKKQNHQYLYMVYEFIKIEKIKLKQGNGELREECKLKNNPSIFIFQSN